MRFGRLDLNLLVVLDILFEEQNVSAAARRLNLSQSATSGALFRLRDYFGDELLVASGGRMMLTARAEELRDPVRESLMFIGNRIAQAPNFDPETAHRTFKVATSDYMLDVALAPFLRMLGDRAPGLSVDISLPSLTISSELHRGELDLLVSLSDLLEDRHPKVSLFSDDHVVVAWDKNPHIKDGVDKELFLRLPQIAVHFGNNRTPAHIERFFSSKQVARRIVTTVPFFGAVPPLIVGTERLATMMRRQAELYAELLPIRLYPVPFPVPDMHEVAQYHTSRTKDVGLQWLIKELASFVSQPRIEPTYRVER